MDGIRREAPNFAYKRQRRDDFTTKDSFRQLYFCLTLASYCVDIMASLIAFALCSWDEPENFIPSIPKESTAAAILPLPDRKEAAKVNHDGTYDKASSMGPEVSATHSITATTSNVPL